MNKIFTFGYNRPDLLEKQYESLMKNIIGDFEFYLVYDHIDDKYTEEFEKVCSKCSIDVYDHQRETNFGNSENHASSMQWIYDNFLNDKDNVLFLDHDIFLIDEFDINSYFNEYDIFGGTTSNGVIEYFSTVVFGFNFKKIKKFNLSFSPGVYNNQYLDTFGNSYLLLENDSLKKKVFEQSHYEEDSNKIFQLMDEKFIHLYGASKWYENFEFYEKDEDRKNSLFSVIDKHMVNNK